MIIRLFTVTQGDFSGELGTREFNYLCLQKMIRIPSKIDLNGLESSRKSFGGGFDRKFEWKIKRPYIGLNGIEWVLNEYFNGDEF